jgi:hypothetical protein
MNGVNCGSFDFETLTVFDIRLAFAGVTFEDFGFRVGLEKLLDPSHMIMMPVRYHSLRRSRVFLAKHFLDGFDPGGAAFAGVD